jgi:tetratricopeptide (TPR) repeat protein
MLGGEATGWITAASSLPKSCPWNGSAAVIEAIVVAPDATPTTLRQAAALAWRLRNMAAAERAYSKIPEADRSAADWLTLGVAVGKQGRHDEAIAITGRVEGDDHAPWVKSNVAWFSVRRTSGSSYRAAAAPSREEAEGWIRDLEDARKTLLERKPAGWEDVRHRCLGTRAEIQRVTGDLEGAIASLDRAQAEAPLNGEQLLCRARVLAARGDKSAALVDAKAALAAVHPESNDAVEARALMGEVV